MYQTDNFRYQLGIYKFITENSENGCQLSAKFRTIVGYITGIQDYKKILFYFLLKKAKSFPTNFNLESVRFFRFWWKLFVGKTRSNNSVFPGLFFAWCDWRVFFWLSFPLHKTLPLLISYVLLRLGFKRRQLITLGLCVHYGDLPKCIKIYYKDYRWVYVYVLPMSSMSPEIVVLIFNIKHVYTFCIICRFFVFWNSYDNER